MALTGGAAILAKLRSQRAAKVPEQPVVIVTYASQTGTSQDIAQSIHAECNERRIKAKVLSLNDLKFGNLSPSKTPIVISVVSSTGDGDPPDNSQTFFKDMKQARTQQEKVLKGVKYTCLGLGDSNYTSFMAIPQRFKKGFDDLGAERFYECREVDEVEGLEELVETWIDALWEPLKATLAHVTPGGTAANVNGATEEKRRSLSQELSRSLDLKGMTDSLLDFRVPADLEIQGLPAMPVCSVRAVLSTSPTGEKEEEADGYHLADRHPARLLSAQRLTAEWSDREVYEMVLDLGPSGMTYSPGDSLDILPENDPTLVDKLLKRLKLDGSQFLSLEAIESTETLLPHIMRNRTLRECFLHCLDLCSALKKTVLRFLAQFCEDQEESHRLKYLVSKAGREAYHKFILSAKASLIDVLLCFPSCQPPLAGLLELLPPLMPRLYSVASCPKVGENSVRIAFSVAKYSTPYGERTGIATGWLKRRIETWQTSDIHASMSFPIRIRSGGSFRLPHALDKPLILVGPGTGIAPFLGFLAERRTLTQEWEDSVGPCWLFFGCRREDEDYLFREELKSFCEDGTITHFHAAFSRKTDQKVYVQHLMMDHSKDLYRDLFQNDGFVLVCGDGTAMAQDVHMCLAQILMRHEGLTEPGAKEKLSEMLKDLRYVKDIWS